MQRKTKLALLAATVIGLGGLGGALAQPGPGPGPGGPPPGGMMGPGAGGGPGMMQGGAPGGGPGWHRGMVRERRGGGGGFAAGEAFARADANNDGRVTREEGWTWLQARFAEVDANHDGGVTLDEAAQAYAAELARFASVHDEWPSFAVCFLGVGPDGHIASLFPDRPEVTVTDAAALPVRNSPKPPPERVTLT